MFAGECSSLDPGDSGPLGHTSRHISIPLAKKTEAVQK